MLGSIRIYCKNNKQYYDIPCGTSILELYHLIGLELKYPVVAARVNYKLQNLNFLIYKPKDIEFLDASSSGGMRCYVRTLSMIMGCAVKELNESYDLRIEHPISKGYLCSLRTSDGSRMETTPEMIATIKQRMHTIISEDREIVVEEKQTKEVMRLFAERFPEDSALFQTLGNPYCRYYRMGDYIDYYTDALMIASISSYDFWSDITSRFSTS